MTFQAGESTKTVAVPIVGDDDIEPHESFFLRLTNVTGATPGALDSSLAFIINDDFDSDGDGLVDGRDPDEIGEIVTALPRQSIGSGNRKAFLDRLDQIETLIVVGDLYDAIGGAPGRCGCGLTAATGPPDRRATRTTGSPAALTSSPSGGRSTR